MGLETGSTISSFITSNPTSSDPVNQGDDHLRLIKSVLQAQFPGSGGLGYATAITTTEAQLNFVTGVTSNIQTQINNVATNANLTGAVTSVGNVTTVVTNANLTGAITSVGNAASLGSFTSAQLAAALTNETGSGANVFATSPVLVTPDLGTPSSGVLTNCTGTANSLNAGIGVNQTWQVVTGSRAVSTTYYNTTGKSIYVLIDGLTGAIGFVVNGNTALSGGGQGAYSFIVPDTNSYSLTASGFNRWSELR